MKLAILNTTILTNDGVFKLETISLQEARKLMEMAENNFISAIGHESTADILTTLLGVKIPVNRIMFKQEPGQNAICFKLNGRPQEGQILTKEEIKNIGYTFKILKMKDF